MCEYTQVEFRCGHCRYTVRAWCTHYEKTHKRCPPAVVAVEYRRLSQTGHPRVDVSTLPAHRRARIQLADSNLNKTVARARDEEASEGTTAWNSAITKNDKKNGTEFRDEKENGNTAHPGANGVGSLGKITCRHTSGGCSGKWARLALRGVFSQGGEGREGEGMGVRYIGWFDHGPRWERQYSMR
ncbi:hypothetical protein BUE80_DR012554 [Diplocarpon rosae]|nr:hypothetical protein BUE80_DR012554 [Diplocarpon rosae]